MKKIVIVIVLVSVGLFIALLMQNTGMVVKPKLDLSSNRPLAPDFTLDALHGQPVTLSAQRPKVVILNFWATWCPPCREEIPSMNRLYEMMRDKGVEIIAVNIEADGPVTVPKFIQEHPIAFPVLFDVSGQVHTMYGVAKYPETFIIDQDGVVVNKVVGGTDWSDRQVVDYLTKLLNKR